MAASEEIPFSLSCIADDASFLIAWVSINFTVTGLRAVLNVAKRLKDKSVIWFGASLA